MRLRWSISVACVLLAVFAVGRWRSEGPPPAGESGRPEAVAAAGESAGPELAAPDSVKRRVAERPAEHATPIASSGSDDDDGLGFPARPARVRPAAEVGEEIRRLALEPGTNPVPFALLIRELQALGSPEAVDLLLEMLNDRDLEFPDKNTLLANALQNADHPDLYESASRLLDDLCAGGPEEMAKARGCLKLIARKGGAKGAEQLVDLIRNGPAPLDSLAASLVPEMEDPAAAAALASLIRDGSSHSGLLLNGLARWRAPEADAELLELAWDGELSPVLRRTAMRSAARNARPAGLEQMAELYLSTVGEEDRLIALDASGVLLDNPSLKLHIVRQEWLPVLSAALEFGQDSVRRKAVDTLNQYRPLRTRALAPALREALVHETEVRERRVIENLLQDLEDED